MENEVKILKALADETRIAIGKILPGY